MTDKERLLSKVNKTESCWLWTGAIRKGWGGYGAFLFNGKNTLAHRASYFLHFGEIGSKHVLHKCDNPPCVNPDHLYLGDDKQNTKDKVSRGRQAQGEKHANAKRTEAFIKKLRSEYDGRYGSVARLARKYNIHPGTTYNLIFKIRWKHV